jgi:hypothetical protein
MTSRTYKWRTSWGCVDTSRGWDFDCEGVWQFGSSVKMHDFGPLWIQCRNFLTDRGADVNFEKDAR